MTPQKCAEHREVVGDTPCIKQATSAAKEASTSGTCSAGMGTEHREVVGEAQNRQVVRAAPTMGGAVQVVYDPSKVRLAQGGCRRYAVRQTGQERRRGGRDADRVPAVVGGAVLKATKAAGAVSRRAAKEVELTRCRSSKAYGHHSARMWAKPGHTP